MPRESAVDIHTEDKGREARLPHFRAHPRFAHGPRSLPPSAGHGAAPADAGRDPTREEDRRARGSGALAEAGRAGGSGGRPASAVAVERFTQSSAKAYPASTQKAAASVSIWDKVVFQPKHLQ